jgi:hypothetical protein
MKCPKCGSENVNVQMVSETKLNKKRRGIIYWLFFGWLIELLLWFFLTIPMLIIAIFKPKNYKTKTKHKSMCVCQAIGNHWQA